VNHGEFWYGCILEKRIRKTSPKSFQSRDMSYLLVLGNSASKFNGESLDGYQRTSPPSTLSRASMTVPRTEVMSAACGAIRSTAFVCPASSCFFHPVMTGPPGSLGTLIKNLLSGFVIPPHFIARGVGSTVGAGRPWKYSLQRNSHCETVASIVVRKSAAASILRPIVPIELDKAAAWT
jgi:hypothetical protein